MFASAIVAAIIAFGQAGAFRAPPQDAVVPLADWLSAAMTWFTAHFRSVFRTVTWLLMFPLSGIRSALVWLPWPAVILICAALGYTARGWKLGLFCAAGLFYTVVIGYWQETALTLALVFVAAPVSVGVGLLLGIIGFRSIRARRVIDPALDLMQTIPTFAYLIPILVLFGIGPVVGVIASAIYAVPPMVRNVILGLQRVPSPIVEAGIMSGSTRRQLLWWVQIPSALPTILIGVNQAVMAALSMVVIAAMVGGVNDIGLEVFNTMKQAKFGQSILAGLVIAVLAMILDRVASGFAVRSEARLQVFRRKERWSYATFTVVLAAICVGAAFVPALRNYPETWTVYPAASMNDALDWFTRNSFAVTSAIKTWVIFYLMLPLKIGLPLTVRPASWGFEMSGLVTLVFAGIATALAILATAAGGWRAGLGIAILALFYYFGTTGLPFPAFFVIVGALAYTIGGPRVFALAMAGLFFILITGAWTNAMVSIQLSAIGVGFSFIIGTSLGMWAALSDRVSAVLRPICDTLQTMPIFVFLIPAVMVFLVGEFTALVAIVMYASVPAIRYTEHGLRNVPAGIVEAARMMGATGWQRLWHVQAPVALPEIVLGLNQTIMMSLAMVVVAALVGAQGLGQDVMVALNQASSGKGLVSGLCIALIAIIADRILQAWSTKKKVVLGLV
jgi:glycine betaine/proline transport system permease protein